MNLEQSCININCAKMSVYKDGRSVQMIGYGVFECLG
jgi:hypothetical protein